MTRLPYAAAILAVATPATGATPAPQPPLPHAVQTFLDRREQCEHWAGEEPYDAQRRKQIERAIISLRCENIEIEKAALRKRYRNDRAILKALEE